MFINILETLVVYDCVTIDKLANHENALLKAKLELIIVWMRSSRSPDAIYDLD